MGHHFNQFYIFRCLNITHMFVLPEVRILNQGFILPTQSLFFISRRDTDQETSKASKKNHLRFSLK